MLGLITKIKINVNVNISISISISISIFERPQDIPAAHVRGFSNLKFGSFSIHPLLLNPPLCTPECVARRPASSGVTANGHRESLSPDAIRPCVSPIEEICLVVVCKCKLLTRLGLTRVGLSDPRRPGTFRPPCTGCVVLRRGTTFGSSQLGV